MGVKTNEIKLTVIARNPMKSDDEAISKQAKPSKINCDAFLKIAPPSCVGLAMTVNQFGGWEFGIAAPSCVGLAMTG